MDKLARSPSSNASTFCAEIENANKMDFKRRTYIPRSPTARKKIATDHKRKSELKDINLKLNIDGNTETKHFQRKRSFTHDPLPSHLKSSSNNEIQHTHPTTWDYKFKTPLPVPELVSTQLTNIRSQKTHENDAVRSKYPKKSVYTSTSTDQYSIYPATKHSQNVYDNLDTMSITSEDVFTTIDREIESQRKRKDVLSQHKCFIPPVVVPSRHKTQCCACSHNYGSKITPKPVQPKTLLHRATQTKLSQETEDTFKLSRDQIKAIETYLKIKPEKLQRLIENVNKGNAINEGISESEEEDSSSDEVIGASQSPVKRRYYSSTQTTNVSKVSK